MTERIIAIIRSLSAFGSEDNFDLATTLSDIAYSTQDPIERDQAIDLLLYCEGNENGPLRTAARAEIIDKFSVSGNGV